MHNMPQVLKDHTHENIQPIVKTYIKQTNKTEQEIKKQRKRERKKFTTHAGVPYSFLYFVLFH